MIARIWHGAVPAHRREAYRACLARTGVPDSRGTPGNLGVTVLERLEGDVAHFVFVSLWESLDTIRAFSGEPVEAARYYPEDREYLLELEPTVTHYEVAIQVPPSGTG
jgi:heme-degrading monooxygenase HmoA